MNKIWTRAIIPLIALILIVMMLIYPSASWEAGVRGLAIWWDVLFPSLFPFFVISELMLGFGIVHFIGKLLDPLMQPLFRIPGTGGFVAAMSFASGYPVSAKLTTKLRRQLLIGREEGERLVAFTTTSDPIFLIGAVSVGFFGNPKLAGALALVHYGSAIIVGLIMRFYGTKQSTDKSAGSTSKKPSEASFSIRLALRAMHEARLVDGRSLGELLRHAVTSSLQLMVVVGGLVVFFSVILEVLTAANVMSFFYSTVQGMLAILHLPPELAQAFVGGTFEVTLGAKASAAPADVPLMFKAAAAAFILSWGGLSVHAQVASILNDADLRYLPFFFARLIHAFLAAALMLLAWKPLMGASPSFKPLEQPEQLLQRWSEVPSLFIVFVKIVVILLILSLLARIIQQLLSSLPRQKGKPKK
ncbi:sporulation integral membrane protein YlbJ [Paenibacillus lutimineralis]|nr:sporulation integral membrane protein YlbJ [Paenibacillus lutimineralis]